MRRALAPLLLLGLAVAPAAARKADEARTYSFEKLNEGVRAYNRGEFLKAEELLGESYNIHLNNFRAAYYLGLARMGARKYAEALEPLERALDYRPRDLPARVSLGIAYLKMGDLAAARTELYRALEVREDFSPAFDGLGQLAEASGQTERARELYLKATTADMGNPDPHMNLGLMSMREGRLAEALREIERAVSLRPDYGLALGTLSRIQTRLGQYNEALSAVRKAMELEPGNPAHPESLGRIYLALDDLTHAEEAFHAALRLDPDHVEASDGLALALRSQGKFDEAADALEWATARERIDPDMARDFLDRARIYRFEEVKLARLRRELLEEAETAAATDGGAPPRGAPGPAEAGASGASGPATRSGSPAPPGAGGGAGESAEGAPGAPGTPAAPAVAEVAADEGTDGTSTDEPREPAHAPPGADDYAELARLSASVRDWKVAALAGERACELAPDDASLARQLAFYLLQAGRVLEARQAYEALEEGGRAEPDDVVNLGVAYARLGSDAQAIEAYGRARESGLAPPEADLFLGLALERSGRRDEARAALERYMSRAGASQGDTAARVERYLDETKPAAAPSHEEVFPDEGTDEKKDETKRAGDERRKDAP